MSFSLMLAVVESRNIWGWCLSTWYNLSFLRVQCMQMLCYTGRISFMVYFYWWLVMYKTNKLHITRDKIWCNVKFSIGRHELLDHKTCNEQLVFRKHSGQGSSAYHSSVSQLQVTTRGAYLITVSQVHLFKINVKRFSWEITQDNFLHEKQSEVNTRIHKNVHKMSLI